MLGDISTFVAPTTISKQLDTLKTEVQQLQLPNKDGNNTTHYKMPTFQIEKFDDYTHQDPVLWWEGFTTQLLILFVAKHAYIDTLFLNSKGGCQTWLSHLASSHGVDVADLKDKISWEELTRLWKKRFIVDGAPALAINRLFGMTQGNIATPSPPSTAGDSTSWSRLEELDPLTFADFQWMPLPRSGRLPKPHCNVLMAQLRDYLHTAVPTPLMDVGVEVVDLHAYIAKIDREFKMQRYDDIDAPLLYVRIQIGEATCNALIDCGASRSYMSQDFMVRADLGPRVRRKSQPTQVTLADGHTHKSIDRCIDDVPVYLAPHASEAVSFDILDTKFDMILGMSWLRSEDHPVNFYRCTVHVRDRNGVLVPCTVAPPHPSINCHVVSAASMRASIIRDDIEEMGGCFLHALPPHDASSTDSSSDPRVTELLDAYGDVFEGPHGVVPDRPIRHEIILEDGAVPPCGCIHRMSEEELSVLRAQLDDLLEKGWIRPSSSPYGAPVLFVRKKNKDLWLCIDYRKLNAQTIRNVGPLPRIDDLLERLGGAKFFSKLDLKSGYHQLEIQKEDRYKTSFKTRYGHFEWLPEFGRAVRTVLERLRQAKYKANRDKYEFAWQELEYLGHYVTLQGIRPLVDKIEALRVWPEPTNTTDIRSFMGLAGYYQRFIIGYSRIVAPMTRLQSPKVLFVFDDDARRSFQALKTAMLMPPVLSIYDPTLPTRVTTDASGYGIGAVLEQYDGDDWHPVEYFIHKVPPINSLDDARKKELLAFVMALKRWRHFLLGRRRFTWVTDNNPLTYYKTEIPRLIRNAVSEIENAHGVAGLLGKCAFRHAILQRLIADWLYLLNEAEYRKNVTGSVDFMAQGSECLQDSMILDNPCAMDAVVDAAIINKIGQISKQTGPFPVDNAFLSSSVLSPKSKDIGSLPSGTDFVGGYDFDRSETQHHTSSSRRDSGIRPVVSVNNKQQGHAWRSVLLAAVEVTHFREGLMAAMVETETLQGIYISQARSLGWEAGNLNLDPWYYDLALARLRTNQMGKAGLKAAKVKRPEDLTSGEQRVFLDDRQPEVLPRDRVQIATAEFDSEFVDLDFHTPSGVARLFEEDVSGDSALLRLRGTLMAQLVQVFLFATGVRHNQIILETILRYVEIKRRQIEQARALVEDETSPTASRRTSVDLLIPALSMGKSDAEKGVEDAIWEQTKASADPSESATNMNSDNKRASIEVTRARSSSNLQWTTSVKASAERGQDVEEVPAGRSRESWERGVQPKDEIPRGRLRRSRGSIDEIGGFYGERWGVHLGPREEEIIKEYRAALTDYASDLFLSINRRKESVRAASADSLGLRKYAAGSKKRGSSKYSFLEDYCKALWNDFQPFSIAVDLANERMRLGQLMVRTLPAHYEAFSQAANIPHIPVRERRKSSITKEMEAQPAKGLPSAYVNPFFSPPDAENKAVAMYAPLDYDLLSRDGMYQFVNLSWSQASSSYEDEEMAVSPLGGVGGIAAGNASTDGLLTEGWASKHKEKQSHGMLTENGMLASIWELWPPVDALKMAVHGYTPAEIASCVGITRALHDIIKVRWSTLLLSLPNTEVLNARPSSSNGRTPMHESWIRVRNTMNWELVKMKDQLEDYHAHTEPIAVLGFLELKRKVVISRHVWALRLTTQFFHRQARTDAAVLLAEVLQILHVSAGRAHQEGFSFLTLTSMRKTGRGSAAPGTRRLSAFLASSGMGSGVDNLKESMRPQVGAAHFKGFLSSIGRGPDWETFVGMPGGLYQDAKGTVTPRILGRSGTQMDGLLDDGPLWPMSYVGGWNQKRLGRTSAGSVSELDHALLCTCLIPLEVLTLIWMPDRDRARVYAEDRKLETSIEETLIDDKKPGGSERPFRNLMKQQEDIHSLDDSLAQVQGRLRQLEQRPVAAPDASSSNTSDRLEALEMDVGSLKDGVQLQQTATQQLEQRICTTANTSSSEPRETAPKFDGQEIFCDSMKTDPIPWFRKFELTLQLHNVKEHKHHAYLYSRSGGACQAWLDNLLSKYGVVANDLHTKISWDDLKAASQAVPSRAAGDQGYGQAHGLRTRHAAEYGLDRRVPTLDTLRRAKYKANRDKCEFVRQELECLGHSVTPEGISPLSDRIQAIQEWAEPRNVTDVRSFLGLAGYYQRFIKGYSKIAAHLTKLQCEDRPFDFGEEARESFLALKAALLSAEVLRIYDPLLPTRVTTDASGYGIGAVLEQHDGVDWHLVEYFSKKVPVVHSIDDARKELLAFVHTLKRWRHFLLGRSQFRWVTDNNPLVFYKTQDTVNSTIARWMTFIDQFDFFPDHIPGKSNRFADALSWRPDHCTAVYSTFKIDDDLRNSFIRGYQVDPEFHDKYANCSSPNPAPSHYRIQEGYLLVHTRGKDLLCVPSDPHLRTRLLGEFRDAPATEHFGVNHTIGRLRERFWWPDLLGDVTRYCESCEVCRRCKSCNHRPYGELRPLPVPLRRREAIAMDITGPFPKHKTGVDGILTMVDQLTKFAMFLPCRYHAEAPKLVEVLYAGWIRTKGYPKEIVCDRDTRFMSEFWLALIKRWGSSLKPSSARHPQTYGQTERAHQTAQVLLRTLIRPDQKDWVERLLDVELAYNSSIHPAIGISPFKIEHGSPVTSPLDTITPRTAKSDDHLLFLRRMQELLVKARDQMAKTQQRMSQQANRQRLPCPFRAGDLVWVSAAEFSLEQDISRKLLPKWMGPWPIVAPAGNAPEGPSFTIQVPAHLPVYPVFHCSKLALYTPAEHDDFPGRRSQDPPSMDGFQEVGNIISQRRYDNRPTEYLVHFAYCTHRADRWLTRAELQATTPNVFAGYECKMQGKPFFSAPRLARVQVPPSDRQLRPRPGLTS
ncbi:hypothetical protein CBR_g51465 [Chara braunii]|uniref:Integrase catalytic domain-containing protein n=1 Tax=Chara braunii TaxID=69332 RepID=A0A388K6L7_CHABU|nr:hypothetical protein CBR_g51465 [Chara braunii]|eukprot:GBG65583.1 hypothetical protein CBR_g51465 [Chara braunii]